VHDVDDPRQHGTQHLPHDHEPVPRPDLDATPEQP